MITKETFVNTMNKLEEFDNKLTKIDTAFNELNSDFCSFYTFEPFDIVVELLEEYFNDKEKWLYYFVWDCNWLQDLQYGAVTIDDEPIDLSDWGKVYDFLMEGKDND